MKIRLLFILFLLLLVISGCSEKYEYVIESYSDSAVRESLNEMGAKGCVVDSARRVSDYGGAKYEFIFRCPK